MLRFFIAAMVVVLAAGAARAERRVALVIGEDDYKSIRKLDNAVADAQAVGDMLQKLGFEVTLETDRNLKRTRRALEDFQDDSEGADVALVYYAGHGVEIAGDNRLLPTDADASSLEALKASTMPLEEVRETVAGIAKIGLIILDACRNDPFGTGKAAAGDSGGAAPVTRKQDDAAIGRETAPTSNGGDRSAVSLASAEVVEKAKPGLGRIGRAEGVLFAFSAAPGETAVDGADGHSPFAQALVKYLGTDGLEVRSALTLVQQEVYDLSRGKQLPYVESGLPSLFFAATTKEQLPERERLLLAMADITPDLRAEVELVAAQADMPLAPLYGALISADLASATDQDRLQKLAEAAKAYAGTREAMRRLASDDPRVEQLRSAAEQDLALGAFDKARASLAAAAEIDAQSGEALAANLVKRRVSEAATHTADAGVAWTQLDYPAAIAALEQAATLHDKIADEDLEDSARSSRNGVLASLGDLYELSGNAGKALDAFQRMRMAAEIRVSKGGGGSDAERDLAISHQKIGDFKKMLGDLSGAMSAYDISLAIRTRLAASAPNDPDAQRNVAVTYQHMGDAYRLQGNLTDALAAYQADFDISVRLAARAPANAAAQLDVAVSHTTLGETREELGDLDGALAEYRAGLAIREAITRSNPANPEWQRDLSISLERIGDALLEQGVLDGALRAFEEERDIAVKLAARDPGNAELQRDLALSQVKLGGVEFERRDLEAALASYEAGRAIITRLVALDSDNAVWQRDLSISLNKVASVHVERRDFAGALAAYKQSLAIRTRLAAIDPSNMQAQSDLSFIHDRIGNTMRAQGDMEGALAELKASADIVAKLAASDPQNAKWQSDLSDSLAKVAAVLDAMGEPDSALDRYRASFEIAERLAASDPSNVGWQVDYIITSVNLAEHGDKPVQRYETALKVAQRLQREGRLTEAKAWMVDDLKSRLDQAKKVAQ